MELRGWLRTVAVACNASDPDWHYTLEVDATWLNRLGAKLNHVYKVGNITVEADDKLTTKPNPYTQVGIPHLKIELAGWYPNVHPEPVPAGWTTTGQPGCPTAFWSFPPMNPLPWQSPLKAGDYVRIVGGLITDAPHQDTEGIKRIQCFWGGGFFLNETCYTGGGADPQGPDHPARWTEMHPPDVIDVLPYKDQMDAIQGLAVGSERGSWWSKGDSQGMRLVLWPRQPKPSWATGVGFEELVLPGTNTSTIVEGNASKTGAKITVGGPAGSDTVQVDIAVQGDSWWGASGKFAAIYRVFWLGSPPSFAINPSDTSVIAGQSIHFAVTPPSPVTWSKVRDGTMDVNGTYQTPASICVDHPIRIGASANVPGSSMYQSLTTSLLLKRTPELRLTPHQVDNVLEASVVRFVFSPTNYPVSWAVQGVGSIDPDGTYHAPSIISRASVTTVTASGTDQCGIFSLRAFVSLLPPLKIDPVEASLGAGQHILFILHGSERECEDLWPPSESLSCAYPGIGWAVTSGDGWIAENGLYFAPRTVAANHDAIVVATDSSSSRRAQAVVHLHAP